MRDLLPVEITHEVLTNEGGRPEAAGGIGSSMTSPPQVMGLNPYEEATVWGMAEHVTSIEAVEGDITSQRVDAIVNAANGSLLGGGGVDGAIHRAAGPRLLQECRELRSAAYPQGLPVGEAVATGAGDLPATWVIHTVGPNRHAGQTDPALLASCFENSLREAVRVGAQSVAFPAISAGIFGWDPAEVAGIAIATVRGSSNLPKLDLVRFVLFGAVAHKAFVAALH